MRGSALELGICHTATPTPHTSLNRPWKWYPEATAPPGGAHSTMASTTRIMRLMLRPVNTDKATAKVSDFSAMPVFERRLRARTACVEELCARLCVHFKLPPDTSLVVFSRNVTQPGSPCSENVVNSQTPDEISDFQAQIKDYLCDGALPSTKERIGTWTEAPEGAQENFDCSVYVSSCQCTANAHMQTLQSIHS